MWRYEVFKGCMWGISDVGHGLHMDNSSDAFADWVRRSPRDWWGRARPTSFFQYIPFTGYFVLDRDIANRDENACLVHMTLNHFELSIQNVFRHVLSTRKSILSTENQNNADSPASRNKGSDPRTLSCPSALSPRTPLICGLGQPVKLATRK